MVTWFATSAPHGAIFLPLDSKIQSIPYKLKHGWMGNYQLKSFYYANVKLNTILDIKF